ncbi:MAG: hormogonium polysaccharide biosynthesis protein HpsA, partial [Planktothrix agardhii]|uniref:hormogonium polysaccharide biosynthesis protein HpsA n=1 Tax=Planktothrix agardhii TaxID=1160 RepID=UPI003C65AF77
MTRNLTRSLLRSLMLINRQDRYSRAGFVLPTVTMVLLVVVLLTIAISFRALERSQDARMVRVSQEALNAATPAVDRGRAKIEQMFKDLEGKVLDEPNFYQTLTSGNFTAYRFKDEEVLRVQFDSDPDNNGIQPNGSAPANDGRLGEDDDNFRDNERIRTAWRFPVDTNNDGLFDSFVLYGLFFRSPEDAKRSPLEARTLPMPPFKSATRPECQFASGQNASLVTASGWSPMEGKLKKSIFVYTTTVPATPDDIQNFVDNVNALGGNQFNAQQFKKYEGEPSFTALEYQQDWKQKYLTGVVYENDLDITPGPTFNLNGNLYTQGNLIVSHFGNGLNIYQISSINSCFYQQEKSKIVVGGNVINGMMGNNLAANILPVNVHLFNGTTTPTVRTIDTTEQSISNGAYAGAFNDFAYRSRLEALVQWQEKDATGTTDPTSVKEAVSRRMADDSSLVKSKVRREELQSYFKDRLRKVTFAEVSSVNNKDVALSPYGLPPSGTNPLQGSGDTLRPPDLWTSILTAMVTVTPSRLSATKPETQQASRVETVIGDRVVEGNNLPALKLDSTNKWVTATTTIANDKWTDTTARTRVSQLSKYPSAGDRSRDGFWEKLAAREPFSEFSNFGGLRVVTGAGVYERDNSFLPRPKWYNSTTLTVQDTYDDPATTATTETFDIVWPDTMPMSPVLGVQIPFNNDTDQWDTTPLASTVSGLPAAATPTIDPTTRQYLKGDLRMRATAVYHYAQDAFNPSTDPPDLTQKPIACVSSYYDPSDKTTAKNMTGLDGGVAGGRSNNGIVYPFPDNRPTSATLASNGWEFTAPTDLAKQANKVFPDGRFANKPLRDALTKLAASQTLTLADQSALDTTLCALSILNGAT